MESSKDDVIETNLTWSTHLEDVIRATGEQANGLAWIHKQSEQIFSRLKNVIELPVIVLSTAGGFCSVGSTTIFGNSIQWAPLILGILSLFVSVLNTINSYFGWAKRAEGHRIAAIQHARLFRFINIELSIPRTERMVPSNLLKMVRETVDRLSETSPLCPASVLNAYNKKFVEHYKDISHPLEVNGLHKINVVRNLEHIPTPRNSSSSERVTRTVSEDGFLPVVPVRDVRRRSRSDTLVTAVGDDEGKGVGTALN